MYADVTCIRYLTDGAAARRNGVQLACHWLVSSRSLPARAKLRTLAGPVACLHTAGVGSRATPDRGASCPALPACFTRARELIDDLLGSVGRTDGRPSGTRVDCRLMRRCGRALLVYSVRR